MLDSQEKILCLLQNGKYHSAASVSNKLDIQLSVVQKYLVQLEDSGVLTSVHETNEFKLLENLDLLSARRITNYLSLDSNMPCFEIKVFQSLDSTNKYAREQAEAKTNSGLVVLAEQQTAGRGRRGKRWVSPFASNIYMSIVWDFFRGAKSIQGLSLAVGVGVRRALLQLDIKDVKLKWPNDIFVNNRKLGGILVEIIGDPNNACTVVVGIGLNVTMPESQAVEIDQDWIDLSQISDANISRDQLSAKIIGNIFEVLKDFDEIGFSAYLSEWQSADFLKNKTCMINMSNDSITGTVLGVDNSGALRMRLLSGEEKRFLGGEISVRINK